MDDLTKGRDDIGARSKPGDIEEGPALDDEVSTDDVEGGEDPLEAGDEMDEGGEDEEAEEDGADPEEDPELSVDDEVKPVRQASFIALPILIRCAEAREDQAAAEAYALEYEIAKKDRSLTEEAKGLVSKIERGIHSGAALSSEGLRLEPMAEALFAKLAALFGTEAQDDSLTVKEGDSRLTVTRRGVVTVAGA